MRRRSLWLRRPRPPACDHCGLWSTHCCGAVPPCEYTLRPGANACSGREPCFGIHPSVCYHLSGSKLSRSQRDAAARAAKPQPQPAPAQPTTTCGSFPSFPALPETPGPQAAPTPRRCRAAPRKETFSCFLEEKDQWTYGNQFATHRLYCTSVPPWYMGGNPPPL